MAAVLNQLIKKVNVARASKFLLDRQLIDTHVAFPRDGDEEAELVKQMLYEYLKNRFVGCKIRSNSLSFSVRLDGQIHKKVIKVKELLQQNIDWKKWFNEHHRELVRPVERYSFNFNGEGVETRDRDGRKFIYVPLRMNRIHGFNEVGILPLIEHLEKQYKKEIQIAEHYDQAIVLMEQEVARRAEARQKLIELDREKYMTHINNTLIKRITSVNPDGITFEDKLSVRMHAWCLENGIEPAYAMEPTYNLVVPKSMNVEILCREENTDEDWYAVPTFGGYEIPEGFTKVEGYGDVTDHDETHKRSREGVAPIVVIRHMFCQFDINLWNSHFPEHYDQLLDATRHFSNIVAAEVAELEEAEKLRQEIEERERIQQETLRLQEEAIERRREEGRQAEEKAARDRRLQEMVQEDRQKEQAEQERVEQLREELRRQLHETQEAERAMEPDPVTFPDGIYLNTKSIPLERYVAIHGGVVRRFANRVLAISYLRGEGLTLQWIQHRGVRDYYETENIVETIGP